MASVREQIIAQVVTLLKGGTLPSGLVAANITRSNTFQVNDADGSLPGINVYPGQEKILREGDADAHRIFTLYVECRAKGAPPIDQQLDPILVYVVQTLLADDTLSGLVWRVQEVGTEWVFETADEDMCGARVAFDVQYVTSRNDASVNRTA
jgi:hypothetical protein